MTRTASLRLALPGALVCLALMASGCSDGDKAASGTVQVTGVDYDYKDLPSTVKAGTILTFTNRSSVELHELVAYRLPADEKRSVGDLVGLPRAELDAILAGPPRAVLLAPPAGAPQIPAVGDGTLKDPGRYAVFCSIPIGADPAAYLQAAASSGDEPPVVAGGQPHFTRGMYGQITVE